MTLTLKQFLSTRERCEDIGKLLSDARWEGEPEPASGFIYMGGLYIEEVKEHWPEKARKAGKYHLIIANCEWITDDLKSLERRLFEFAKGEGYTMEEFERTKEARR